MECIEQGKTRSPWSSTAPRLLFQLSLSYLATESYGIGTREWGWRCATLPHLNPIHVQIILSSHHLPSPSPFQDWQMKIWSFRQWWTNNIQYEQLTEDDGVAGGRIDWKYQILELCSSNNGQRVESSAMVWQKWKYASLQIKMSVMTIYECLLVSDTRTDKTAWSKVNGFGIKHGYSRKGHLRRWIRQEYNQWVNGMIRIYTLWRLRRRLRQVYYHG